MRIAACLGLLIVCVACTTFPHPQTTQQMVVMSIDDVTFSLAIPNLPDGAQLAVLWVIRPPAPRRCC